VKLRYTLQGEFATVLFLAAIEFRMEEGVVAFIDLPLRHRAAMEITSVEFL
jgi:hypothetical protein